MPDTGGANIPALNDLISPLNMAFRLILFLNLCPSIVSAMPYFCMISEHFI